MDYAAYIKIVRVRAGMTGGREEIYIGALMAANVVSALTGTGISGLASNYYPLFNGEIVDPGTIEQIIKVPGIEISQPILPSSSYGFVKAGAYMPSIYRKPFNYKYIPLMGRDYQNFMTQLISLYKTRLYPTGMLTAAEQLKINRVLDAGFIVMPTRTNTRGDNWNAVVAEFDKAHVLYNNNMVKEGMLELEKSKRNAAFWNAMVAITETVAMPVTLVTDAAMFSWNYRKPLIIAGMSVIGYILYRKANKARKRLKRIVS